MTKDFKSTLALYKKLIDEDIKQYCDQVDQRTLDVYGEKSALVSHAYSDLLQRDSKRVRGVLVLVGHEMCGGKNTAAALQAARAVEMMHAYMLIVDDIQDRAEVRRGLPSVHKILENTHIEQNWSGEAAHTGISLALNAALLGSHGAGVILANLEIDPELRVKVLSIMNHTMVVTAHGQSHDIINEINSDVTADDIEKVMQWKTAHYSILNPIHMGMVIAGAGCEDTNAITEYALNLGKAFQITDDLLVLDNKGVSGKNGIDDIREGKQTLLTVFAAARAAKNDLSHLNKCLGNPNLTEADFTRCQEIIINCGAADYARAAASDYIKNALTALDKHKDRWNKDSVDFLNGLAEYILRRTA